MSFVLIITASLLFTRMKYGIKEPVNDYISKESSLAVKGFFVLTVIYYHAGGYIPYNNNSFADILMYKTLSGMGQLIVVPFLFYSGYGICVSAINKKNYARDLPLKRLLPLLLKFDIAVALFLMCDFIIGKNYAHKTVFLSLLAYDNVGNSNWFIFATLVMYIIVFAAFMLFKKNRIAALSATTALTVCYIAVMILLKKPAKWYETIIVFPLGMWFALFKEQFDKITKKFKNWLFLFAVFFIAFVITWYVAKTHSLFLHFRSIFFALSLVTFTRHFSPRNKILEFFGKHVFSFFILQRIPMILLSNYFPNINVYLFLALSIITTCALGIAFDSLIKPETLFAASDKTKPQS